jgi:hypothetical protein
MIRAFQISHPIAAAVTFAESASKARWRCYLHAAEVYDDLHIRDFRVRRAPQLDALACQMTTRDRASVWSPDYAADWLAGRAKTKDYVLCDTTPFREGPP